METNMERPSFPLDEASIRSLRVFVAVTDTENFSEVARQMRISVSSVSKQIAALEEALGTALLYRTTRRVTVTEEGKRFQERCIAILNEIDTAVATGTGDRHKITGHIRISAPPSVTSAILSPQVSGFMRRYPEITLDFFVTSALPDIVRHRIDAAIVLREWPGVKMASRKLGSMNRVLCASPAYLAEHGTPLRLAELSQHNCIQSLLSGDPEPWIAITKGKRRNIAVGTVLCSDNGDFIRQACISGVGIANLYEFHAKADLEAGRLVRLMPEKDLEKVGLYAIFPHKDLVSGGTLAFLDFMQMRLPGNS
ncbi:LysR family transcriptional regulator [Paracoccus wurundjeri]|uniref:LysR family transcriptional regulator n=1 Tax=Paracoccus onubensis TaxID=1675788 RepID=UPI00351D8747